MSSSLYGPCEGSIAGYDPVHHQMILLGGSSGSLQENSTLTEVRIFDAENPTANGTALPPLSSGTVSFYQPFEREESGNYILHWVDPIGSTMRRYDMSDFLFTKCDTNSTTSCLRTLTHINPKENRPYD